MADALLVVVLLLVYVVAMAVCAMGLIALSQVRLLLRQVRKLASLYPPFPVAKDPETGKEVDQTKVEFQEQWNDDLQGRS